MGNLMEEWMNEAMQSYISEIIDWLTDFYTTSFDLSKPFNVVGFTRYIQIACSLILVVLVLYKAIRIVDDPNTYAIKNLILSTFASGIGIWLLPFLTIHVIMPFFDAVFDIVALAGKSVFKIDYSSSGIDLLDLKIIQNQTTLMAFGLLIALIASYVSMGILYFQFIIAYIASPIMAMLHIISPSKLRIWLAEILAILLTRTLYMFLFILFMDIATYTGSSAVAYLIGYTVLIFKGNSMIRRYIYSTGLSDQGASLGQMLVRTAVTAVTKT